MTGWLQQAALWTWQNSLAAGALAAAVLAMRRVFRGRIAPQWLCLAGWLVMLRLMLPAPLPHAWAWDRAWTSPEPKAAAESPVRSTLAVPAVQAAEPSLVELRHEIASARAVLDALKASGPGEKRPAAVTAATELAAREHPLAVMPAPTLANFRRPVDWQGIAAWVWATGAVCFFGHTLVRHRCFIRRLAGTANSIDLPWPGLAGECAAAVRLRRVPPLLTITGSDTPFLCGLFRPQIILPEHTLAVLTREEARHVLLHEMLHIARRDLAANWLLTAVRALHWFNPFIHIASRRLLADRELLRDRQALALLKDPAERSAYGHTLLKLALPLSAPAPSPGLAPLFHSEKELKRRLTMIQSPLRHQRLAACIAAVALAITSAPLFTTARGQEKAEPAKASASSPAAGVSPAPAPAASPAQDPNEQELNKLPGQGSAQKIANIQAMTNRSKLEQDVNKMETQLKSLLNLKGEQLIAGAQSLGVQDATSRKVYPEYLELKSRRSSLIQSGFGKNHPEMKGLSDSIRTKYAQLEAAVESYKSSLKVQIEISKQMLANAEKKDKTNEPPAPSAEKAGTPVREVKPLQSLEDQIRTQEKALEAARSELLDVMKTYHIVDIPGPPGAFLPETEARAADGSLEKQGRNKYAEAKANYEAQLQLLNSSKFQLLNRGRWQERMRAIAARLVEKGQKEEAEAIEQALGELSSSDVSSAIGAAADELKQLRAEVAEIKAALSAVMAHSTGEAKWQNELIQSQEGLEKLVPDGKTVSVAALTPAELSLGVIPSALKFDKEEMTVRAGQRVRLTFKNEKCPLMYNFVLVKPRTRDAVGALADQMATDPGAAAKLYIPDSPYIIAKSSKLIRAGESDVIEFSAPSIPGEYPYICTFPGHWRLMRGILKVEGRGDINAVMKSDDGGPVAPAYIGIVAGTVRVKVEGDTGVTSGARVSALGGPESPAVEAGLLESDVIVGFDGKLVRDAEDLLGLMATRSPGTEVKLEFVRNGERKSAVVKLGDRAKLLKSFGKSEFSMGLMGLPLGLAVPGRPGFVRSPYAPELGLVDVSGAKKGAKVRCPYSGNFFRVPDFKRSGSPNSGKP